MAKATLTTLTPVHVGSGEKLFRNFDFTIGNGKLGLIDLRKITALTGRDKAAIQSITDAIEKKISPLEYLQNKRQISPGGLEEVCSRIMEIQGRIGQQVNELKTHYYTALRGAAIPGSSLKGSLRSSILAYLTNPKRLDPGVSRLLAKKINTDRRADQVFAQLDKLFFGETANAKTTRFLQVGDAVFPATGTVALELSYENQKGSNGREEWRYEGAKAQIAECIPAGAEATFQLKLDLKQASVYTGFFNKSSAPNDIAPLRDLSVYGRSLTDFLRNINQVTISLIQHDYDLLEEEGFSEEYLVLLDRILSTAEGCGEGEAVIRVGAHAGWKYITHRWMMGLDDSIIPDGLKDAIQKKTQKTDRYLGKIFPKTRKLTEAGQPLGFVKIKLHGQYQ